MSYFLTGSSGFIGSAVKRHLWAKAEGVFCKDRSLDVHYWAQGLKYCDTVINCGAYGNHANQTLITEMIYVNLTRLGELLEMSAGKMFYNISSSSVHLKVQTPYSLTKKLGEIMVQQKGGINIRPYSVFGPGEAAFRFIPTVIRCLNTGEAMVLDPNAVHDWIYIDDFVEAMFAGETEIGTGTGTTNLDVVKMLEEISGKKLKYTEAKLRDYDCEDWVCPKGVKARTLFEGLKQTYEKLRGTNF